MELDLHLGTSKIDITPNIPVPLAGFGSRSGPSHGVSHRLYARIFVFEQATASGERSKGLIVSADLIGWGTERMDFLRKSLQEKHGIDISSIILQGTHTHSGPQTSTNLLSIVGPCDRLYVQELENKLFAGVEQALHNLESVSVERGKGQCDININRRKIIDGHFHNAPNEEGLVDRDVNVIRFLKKNGGNKAIMVHYTCHPTTTSDYAVSSEFCGVAMEQVEKELGGDVMSGFLQGCSGDIRPALIRDGRFYSGTDKEVCEEGEKLAAEVIAVLNGVNGGMKSLKLSPFKSAHKEVSLRLQPIPAIEELEANKNNNDAIGAWSRLLLNDPQRIRPTIDFDMVLLKIADGLSFMAMNGEVVVEYGLFIKHTYGDQIIPVPYSNGLVGYIPTARQLDEGGYEPKDSCIYFGMPAPFDPSLEEDIRRGVVQLADDVL